MTISKEHSPHVGKYVVEVKIVKKWVQCTNPITLLEALADRAAKQKRAPDCTFRIMEITATGLKEARP